MSKSRIEWTQETWNPIVGCSIVSPGCTNCYAMKMAARIEAMGNQPRYTGTTKKINGNAVWTGLLSRAPDSVLLAPLRRKKPTTYFVNSMGDLFHEDCPDEWIDKVFAVMALCPQHTFQVLTKRAGRMRDAVERIGRSINYLEKHARSFGRSLQWNVPSDLPSPLAGKTVGLIAWPLRNVWLGVSTERQQEADERIPLLLQTPAAIRFISAEPLLGPINLTDQCNGHYFFNSLAGTRWHDDPDHVNPAEKFAPGLDWVIVGGESGPGYRGMLDVWAWDMLKACSQAGVPFFMKQMAGKKPIPVELFVREMPERAP